MEEYQSNSHKSREKREAATPPPKKVEAVVTGSRKKQSGFKKLADMFIKEDAHNVGTYILTDVLIPALVKIFFFKQKTAYDMFFYGQAGRSRRNGGPIRVNYRGRYNGDSDWRDRPVARSRFDYDDIEFDSRGDAEMVLDAMRDIIARYDVVTVNDLYDLANLDNPYTMQRYGWINLDSAYVMRNRNNKFVLKLPRPSPIDD